ncbi:MAG TPA: MarR family transcriptional regulator [Acidimicrobiales bacterium]|nr:MarR family transcriptional regulator [Acidimicrobiales bacterium]
MKTPQFDDDDYHEILALRDQLRRFLHWSEAQAKEAGLTPAQHQLLLAVRGHPGGDRPTIGELAEHLQVRHHSAVGLIDRAEAAGLVERLPDDVDGRIVRIRLKKSGQDALDELTAFHVTELRVLAESFASLRLPGSG